MPFRERSQSDTGEHLEITRMKYRTPIAQAYHRPFPHYGAWKRARCFQTDTNQWSVCLTEPFQLKVADGADKADFLGAREQAEKRWGFPSTALGMQPDCRVHHGEDPDKIIGGFGVEFHSGAPYRCPEFESPVKVICLGSRGCHSAAYLNFGGIHGFLGFRKLHAAKFSLHGIAFLIGEPEPTSIEMFNR